MSAIGITSHPYEGRLAVRASGRCSVTTARHGVVVQGIPVRHCHLLQRSDGSGFGVGTESQHLEPAAR